MNEMEAVTRMAVYLKSKLPSANIYKYKKPTSFQGEYIGVNSLPITYGKTINETGIVNVNIHVPNFPDESPNTIRLNEFASQVDALIPHENADTEDSEGLMLGRYEFSLLSGSNCIEDRDDTHFINFRVRYTFIDQ